MLERAREGSGSAPKAQAPLGRMVGASRGVIMFSYRYIRYFVTALRWPFEHLSRSDQRRAASRRRRRALWRESARRISSRGTLWHRGGMLLGASISRRRVSSCITVALALASKQLHAAWMLGMQRGAPPTLQQPRCGPLAMQAHRCQRCNTHEKRVLQRDINAAMVGAPWHSRPNCSTAHVSERRQRASQRLSAA